MIVVPTRHSRIMCKKSLLFLIVSMLTGFAAGQTASGARPDDEAAKLQKAAVEFLRETSVEVGRLRTAENRISFNAELASLMWFYDGKEARSMYADVVSDFRDLLARLDAQMNLPIVDDEDMDSSGFLFGSSGKSKAERKLRVAMAVRQQIAMSLAEHAPDLAYTFYYDSLNIITNAAFRKETEQSDKYFESRLINQIAESDAAKAADFGKQSIKRGLNANHIELLKKIYAKDTDKGVELGAAILERLRGEKPKLDDVYFCDSLLSFGSTTFDASMKPGGKKPVYSEADLRDIADHFARAILDASEQSIGYLSEDYVEQIEKYAPGRAIQIRAKFKQSRPVKEMRLDRSTSIADKGANAVPANSNTTAEPERIAREESEKREKQMLADVLSLGQKELPKEERAKIVAESRKIISQTPGKDKKLIGLSLLSAQVAKAGDKDLAAEIMRDAERLVNPEPKNYRDFMLSWLLVSGYAEADPDKAFPILENTILRANETIAAFVRVAEFIDVNGEMVDDGEVQVGMFGGEMVRGMTRDLDMAAGPLRSLARADFEKMRRLTNVFDRAELRVLAKMLVLRAILDNRQNREREAQSKIVLEGIDMNEPKK